MGCIMSKEIKYDFILSKHIVNKLEISSSEYEKVIIKGFADNTDLIRLIWQGEFADLMNRKCEETGESLKQIHNELLKIVDEINALTSFIRHIEDEAKRIAQDNGE